jgi:hypothetical protein
VEKVPIWKITGFQEQAEVESCGILGKDDRMDGVNHIHFVCFCIRLWALGDIVDAVESLIALHTRDMRRAV